MMFYVLLLPRIFLMPPVASAIPFLDDKPLSYRSNCCKCPGPLWVTSGSGRRLPRSPLRVDKRTCCWQALSEATAEADARYWFARSAAAVVVVMYFE
jgi:hypothetical protein